MQSSKKQDSSSDRPLKQDSWEREDAMRQTRRMRGNGATRNSIAGADEETRKRGDSGNREADAAEDQRAGATQDLITGSAEGCGIRGDSKLHTASAARGAKIRGDLEIHRWHRRKVREAGKPEQPPAGEPRKTKLRGNPGDSTSARAGRCRNRGDPETHREAGLEGEDSGEPGDSTPGPTKDARFGGHRRSITGKSRKTSDRGNSKARWEAALVQRICGATRVSKASSAERCESRGNSKLHRRHGLKMKGAGRPATTSEAQHEERRRGDARGFTSGGAAGGDFRGDSEGVPRG